MPTPSDQPLLLQDALHSTPSRRFLADTAIPDHVLWDILDSAVRGPTGGNRQAWGWLVVRDPEVKRPIAEWYREAWSRRTASGATRSSPAPASDTGLSRAVLPRHRAPRRAHRRSAGVGVPGAAQCRRLHQPEVGSIDLRAVQQLDARRTGARHRHDAHHVPHRSRSGGRRIARSARRCAHHGAAAIGVPRVGVVGAAQAAARRVGRALGALGRGASTRMT